MKSSRSQLCAPRADGLALPGEPLGLAREATTLCSLFEKAIAHRSERRRSRSALAVALDEDDDDDDSALGSLGSPREDRAFRSEITWAVHNRRSADKTGPLLRWAKARTRHLRTHDESACHLQSLLGRSTVITDHAIGHFELATGPRHDRTWRKTLRRWRTVRRLARWLARALRLAAARVKSLLLKTGFARSCEPGDRCWPRQQGAPCSARLLPRTARDAPWLAWAIWHRPTPELVLGLATIFRDVGIRPRG